jgi:hypothetical protein
MSTVLWFIVGLLLLAGFAVAARRVQTAPSASGRVLAGIGGALLGIMGVCLIAALVF